MNAIEPEVVQIVSRITKVPASRFTAETDLRTDLNVDSLQGLQIVAAIEKRFGFTVPAEEIDIYTSVKEIVATVERFQANGDDR
jgi:acyl carrier protein